MAKPADRDESKPVQVRFMDLDSGDVTGSHAVSQDLAALLCRAAQISSELEHSPEKERRAHLSFATLFGAILCSPDETSSWMVRLGDVTGAELLYPLSREGFSREHLMSIATRPLAMQWLSTPLTWTASARQAITRAEVFLRHLGEAATALDVRHLFAALLWLPGYHDSDFKLMNLQREHWRARFLELIAHKHPQEAAGWASIAEGSTPPVQTANKVSPAPIQAPRPARKSSRPEAPAHPVLASQQAAHEEPPAHRRALSWLGDDEQRTLYAARYDADVHGAQDLLDIDRDVDALSSLIASRTMAPPLSIGVFGDWGSGKTFFMNKLRQRVEGLAEQATNSNRHQHEVAFYKNIIQIEFNAWHYAEGNLWASLVEHIFRNLRRRQDEPEADIAARREKLLTLLASRESELLSKQTEVAQKEEEAAQAARRVEDLEQQRQARRAELESALTRTRDVLEIMPRTLQLDPKLKEQATTLLAQTGFISLGRTAVEVRDALTGALGELRHTGGFLASLTDGQGLSLRLRAPTIILFGSLAASLAGAAIFSWAGKQDLASVTALLTTVGGFAGSAASWLKQQTQWLRERREALEKQLRDVEQAIQTDIEKQLAPLAEEEAAAKAQLEKLEGQAAEQRQTMQTAQGEVQRLKQEIAELTSARLLDRFILDRTGSDDYRKHLGLVALIRRDFEELSRLMDAVNQDKAEPGTPSINRIVLYIDDLDRCSEQKVVEVLQAVHLLLAFRLFVVVVGVDSRWVARCLTRSFKNLLASDDAGSSPEGTAAPLATAFDYLEKIFQIPIWLRPVGPVHRTSMVKSLLAPPGEPKPVVLDPLLQAQQAASIIANIGRTPTTAVELAQHLEQTDLKEVSALMGSKEQPSPATPQEVKRASVDSDEEMLNPPSLHIGEAELTFIDELGFLLSPSPRVLKRFANTYRLIKACVPRGAQEEFLQGGKEHASASELCLLLLALVTSQQEFATKLFEQIEQAPNTAILGYALMQLRELGVSSARDSRILDWLDNQPRFNAAPMETLQRLVPLVSRFSFQQGR